MPDFHSSLSQLSVLEGVPLGVDPVAHIRASSPLPLHAEELIDRAVTEVGLDRLTIVDDLYAAGMSTPLPDWLGIMNVRWQKRSRTGNPIFSMLPDITVRREDAKPDLDFDTLPVYCISEHFTIHPRLFAEWERAARINGTATLDTSMVSDGVRRMHEAIELATIEGPPIQVNGLTVPGLLDSANVYEYETNTAWTAAGKTGPEIYGDVSGMVDKAQTQHKYGPYRLYVSTKYGRVLNKDYEATFTNSKTTRLRILDDEAIQDVRVADRLPEDTTLLVEMNKTNLDLIVGQMPTVISWLEGPPSLAIRRWLLLACVILRIREDYDGQSGVIVGKPTA